MDANWKFEETMYICMISKGKLGKGICGLSALFFSPNFYVSLKSLQSKKKIFLI